MLLAAVLAILVGLLAGWSAGRAPEPRALLPLYHGLVAGFVAFLVLGACVLLVVYWFRPHRDQSGRVFLYALGAITSAFTAVLAADHFFRGYLLRGLVRWLQANGYDVPDVPPDSNLAWWFVLFSFSVILVLVLWTRLKARATVTERVSPSPVGDWDERADSTEYHARVKDYLDLYDEQVHWFDGNYVPLEASVHAEQTIRLRPKLVKNLITAIRRDRDSRVFVVVGQPGSGKSVSLRNLVRALLAEMSSTRVIPVYANLREFPADGTLTADALDRFVRGARADRRFGPERPVRGQHERAARGRAAVLDPRLV
ncbi:MAG: hypothetical protein FJ304_25730 [Planctomycetes bacterium]|nr:hypothetical protein [Planctomycetota bacterium]